MNREEALKVLRREDSTINKIGHIIAALGWDQDTAMPPSGAEERGEQIALLSSLIHEKSISASLQEAIASLDGEALEGADAALYRVWKKEVTNALKLPADLVMKMSLASNDALSSNLKNIGQLLTRKNVYFVPMRQDDPKDKPHSLVADFSKLQETLAAALRGEQYQRIFQL